jgi:hypothetical protein
MTTTKPNINTLTAEFPRGKPSLTLYCVLVCYYYIPL